MTGPHAAKAHVTLQQVADAAGVSLATASRALNNGPRRVNSRSREAVVSAARTLGYAPSASARAMVRGHSDVVGLIIASIDDPYFAGLASGVLSAANRHRLMLNLALTQRDTSHEISLISAFRGQRARALVMTSSRSSNIADVTPVRQELEAFARSGGGVCLIGTPDWGLPTLRVAHHEAGRLLVERLVALGYRELLVLAGPTGVRTAVERTAGLREAAAELGVSVRVTHGAFTLAGGAEATQQALAEGARPDCIIGVGELMVAGAMQATRAAGLRIPDEVGFASFDDSWVSAATVPSLTSVAFPLDTMGERAVEIALRGTSADEAAVHGQFVLRESTPPRG